MYRSRLSPLAAMAAASMASITSWAAKMVARVTTGMITAGTTALDRTVVRSDTGRDFQNSTLRSRRSVFRAARQ